MPLQEEFERQGNWLFRYRGVLPLIVLLVGAILYVRTETNPETFFLEETPYEIYYELFCLALGLFGLFIRIITVGYTPENTSGRNTKEQVADTINTTGMYSIVRHPLYLGNFFMWLGPAMLTGNFWFMISFCLFYWLYYERIMFAEEQYLRKKFKESYIEWAENVPAFIPSFKNYATPQIVFNWKKILKKEKNGLAALFIIFFVFDIAGELVEKSKDFNYFIIISCIITLLMYGVIKGLRDYTKVLD